MADEQIKEAADGRAAAIEIRPDLSSCDTLRITSWYQVEALQARPDISIEDALKFIDPMIFAYEGFNADYNSRADAIKYYEDPMTPMKRVAVVAVASFICYMLDTIVRPDEVLGLAIQEMEGAMGLQGLAENSLSVLKLSMCHHYS